MQARRALEQGDHARDRLLRLREEHPALRPVLERRDPGEDLLLRPRGDALQVPQRPGFGGLAKVLERLDVELVVDQFHGLGPQAGDLEQPDEARRDLRPEALVVDHVAGRHELGDLVADRLADAGDLRRVAGPIGGNQVNRAAPDRVGRPVVGDRLERDLALDLEDVADLMEDPGEVAVGQLVAAAFAGVIVGVVGVVEVGVVERREVIGHARRW
jgi:hypothetical protein